MIDRIIETVTLIVAVICMVRAGQSLSKLKLYLFWGMVGIIFLLVSQYYTCMRYFDKGWDACHAHVMEVVNKKSK
jgi:hypothetical protein